MTANPRPSSGSHARFHGLSLLIAASAVGLACRDKPAPAAPVESVGAATPTKTHQAELRFVGGPKRLMVKCERGCEGMVIEPGETGEQRILVPVAEGETPIRLELTSPGYHSVTVDMTIVPGVNEMRVDMVEKPKAEEGTSEAGEQPEASGASDPPTN